MNFYKFLLVSGSIALLSLPLFSLAAVTPGEIPSGLDLGIAESPVKSYGGLLGIFARVVQVIYVVFFTFAVMMFLFAAFKYLTEGDNAEEMMKVHWILIYGSIGVVVALLAVGASAIIKNFLGDTGGVSGGATSGGYVAPVSASPSTYTAPPPTGSFETERGAAGGTAGLPAPRINRIESPPVNPRGSEPSVPR